jgi:HK97 family phage prohead protease
LDLTVKAVTTPTTDLGVFEAVVSTESEDREKDVISAAAMVKALRKWTRPIPLTWHHSTKAEDVFGHIEPMTAREADGEVVAGGQVDLNSSTGQEAWRLMKARTLGFSFHAMIPEGGAEKRKGGGLYITELDVIEVTGTITPMNADTRVLATKGFEDPAVLIEALEKALEHAEIEQDFKDRLVALGEPFRKAAVEDKDEDRRTDKSTDKDPPAGKFEQDPLRKQANAVELEFASRGVSHKSPPKIEQPKPDLIPLDDLRARMREEMLTSLSGGLNT